MRVSIAERVEPTPETAAKLRQDVVLDLLASGEITQDHADAAAEIRECWMAQTRGVFFGSTHVRPALTHDGNLVQSGVDLSGGEALWREVWKRWAAALRNVGWVLDVVVDNQPVGNVIALRLALDAWNRLRGRT